ncbi:unnamed protein product [Ectocarpus sp. 4 AP-2014]
MQALHMDVLVDVWAKQDVSDRLEDIGNLKHTMRSGERNSDENRAEFSRALRELERDERSELNELSAWVEIDYDTDLDFKGSIRLGSGSFGQVTTAKWNGSHVAVKYLREDDNRDLVRAIRKEIRTHASLHFDHVVQLYAASTIAPNFCMVMEYAREGSLWQHLHSTSKPLAHSLQAAFLFDIARGLMFLHNKGMLHRDLKSANVLVFANRRLKLCDFGLSKVMAESSSRSKRGPVGTTPWMSPEEINGSAATKLTDVYSFGVVCYEVATRMEPFKGMVPVQVMRAVADKGRRPEIPAGASASPDVVPLMERCWKQDPAQRPEGFAPVVEELCRVVGHLGDPRHHSSAADDLTSSPGVKHNGDRAARVAANTAPLTASGDLWGSPLDTTSVQKPKAATAPTSKISVQDAGTDRAVLMALYSATNGPTLLGIVATYGGWNRTNGWGTSRPISEWHGVTVGNNGRVIRLKLAGNNLRGPIPAELGGLTALTSLDLGENQLSGPIPPSLGGLKLLTYLGLHDNNLTGPIPAELGGLTALEKLGLEQNQLSGPIPSRLGELKWLAILALHENQLSGPIPSRLGELTALTFLALHQNQLSGPIPSQLGELTALTRLGLYQNQLTGVIPPSLGGLKLLTYLGLHDNNLTGIDGPAASPCCSLLSVAQRKPCGRLVLSRSHVPVPTLQVLSGIFLALL